MAHAQKPEFVFPRNGRVHLNRWGHQFSRLLTVEECGSVVVMVVMLDRPRSEVKWNCTGYPLHSQVSPSIPLPYVTVCHQVPKELETGEGRQIRRVPANVLNSHRQRTKGASPAWGLGEELITRHRTNIICQKMY